ncbi:MAG TPA: Fe-S protein assembly chaperone HscA, partial [Polyangiaceae bacterium]
SLREAVEGAKSASSIQSRIDELDAATHDWAGRRMNRAVEAAIGGRSVSEIAKSVEHAAGVDAHLAAHGQGAK